MKTITQEEHKILFDQIYAHMHAFIMNNEHVIVITQEELRKDINIRIGLTDIRLCNTFLDIKDQVIEILENDYLTQTKITV